MKGNFKSLIRYIKKFCFPKLHNSKKSREEANMMLNVLEEKLHELKVEKDKAVLSLDEKAEIDKQVEAYRKELIAEAEDKIAKHKAEIEAQISLVEELIVVAKEKKEKENNETLNEPQPNVTPLL